MISANTADFARAHCRAFACALALGAAVMSSPDTTQAADVGESFLRGTFAPPTEFKSYNNWEGFYLGVTLGHSFMNADMSDSASELIENMLRTTAIENEGSVSRWPSLKGSSSGNVWGGFVGYNWQQDTGLVLGIEGAYQMTSDDLEVFANDRIRRVFSAGGNINDVAVISGGRFAIKDYATVRGRVGYAMGQFLPYASLGLTIARVSYRTHARVNVSENNGPVFTFRDAIDKDKAVAYGANLGLGVDVTLLPNVFLRGEWEYIAFAKLDGIRADMNTFRVGLGLKF